MPTADTTGSHLARSPFTNAANSSGVDGDGTASWVSNCFFSSADRSADRRVAKPGLDFGWQVSRPDQAIPVVREHGLETGLAAGNSGIVADKSTARHNVRAGNIIAFSHSPTLG